MYGTKQSQTRRRKTCKKNNQKRKTRKNKVSSYERIYKGIGLPSIPRLGKFRSETFPAKFRTSLVYQDCDFSLSPAIGNGYYDTHVFRGNSVYDPDYTGVGVQPYYFDNLAAIYNRYRVISSTIVVTLMSDSSSDLTKLIKTTLFPFQLNADPDYSEFEDLCRLPKCKSVKWNQDRNDLSTLTITNTCGTDFFTDNPLDEDWESSVGGNPDTMWYWHLTADTTTVSGEPTIYFDVKITYDVCWYKRASVNES
jgi:hypothetical protein